MELEAKTGGRFLKRRRDLHRAHGSGLQSRNSIMHSRSKLGGSGKALQQGKRPSARWLSVQEQEQEHNGPISRRTLLTPGLARWSSRLARGPLPVTIAWTKNPNLRRKPVSTTKWVLWMKRILIEETRAVMHTWRTWPDVRS